MYTKAWLAVLLFTYCAAPWACFAASVYSRPAPLWGGFSSSLLFCGKAFDYVRNAHLWCFTLYSFMASFTTYHLRILDARGELVESFPPGLLSELVRLATERVADFDAYQTVYRVLRQTGGLYARPFLGPTPAPWLRDGRLMPAPPRTGPFIVHVVSAKLYHVAEQPS